MRITDFTMHHMVNEISANRYHKISRLNNLNVKEIIMNDHSIEAYQMLKLADKARDLVRDEGARAALDFLKQNVKASKEMVLSDWYLEKYKTVPNADNLTAYEITGVGYNITELKKELDAVLEVSARVTSIDSAIECIGCHSIFGAAYINAFKNARWFGIPSDDEVFYQFGRLLAKTILAGNWKIPSQYEKYIVWKKR